MTNSDIYPSLMYSLGHVDESTCSCILHKYQSVVYKYVEEAVVLG
jgi:hypothetical protein